MYVYKRPENTAKVHTPQNKDISIDFFSPKIALVMWQCSSGGIIYNYRVLWTQLPYYLQRISLKVVYIVSGDM